MDSGAGPAKAGCEGSIPFEGAVADAKVVEALGCEPRFRGFESLQPPSGGSRLERGQSPKLAVHEGSIPSSPAPSSWWNWHTRSVEDAVREDEGSSPSDDTLAPLAESGIRSAFRARAGNG